jgi:hypothetical protein
MKANPFAQLLGVKAHKLPKTASSTVVVAGKKVGDERQIKKLLGVQGEAPTDDNAQERAEAARQAKLRKTAYWRAKYQQDRQDPAKIAKREAYEEAHREERRAYMAEYRKRNRERQRELARDWARKNYHLNTDECRAKARAYYQANRERILADLKAQREAAKAAKQNTGSPS